AFDISYPGHYKRRIKSVSVTVPAVVGPYANVPARLSLDSSQIRTSAGANSELFSGPNFAHTAIATSSANNDGGQFELNFQDVRYLPFEGGGAANSKWSLELPNTVRPFDYNTISDVIIHINYTALYDSGLRTAVEASLKTELNKLPLQIRIVSLKQEFPDVWHQLNIPNANAATLEIKANLFPYFAQGGKLLSVHFYNGNPIWAPFFTPKQPTFTKLEYSLDLVKATHIFNDDVLLLLKYEV
ncbi:MAG: hypothetical protein JNJ90_18330, partial [Saprospiraceae bacterium]|nr:hypothetical protein [Saprospiraceae bacterium]